jgi:putative aldouronate transport system permease protein
MAKVRDTTGEKIFYGFNYVFLVLLSFVCLYPMYYVFVGAMSDPQNMLGHRGMLLFPLGLSFDSFRRVFQYPMIPIGYRNTLFYVAAGTAINLFLTTLGAYGLSRKKVMFRNPIMFVIVFTMFFNGGLIPTYLWMNKIHLVNTFWAMLLPKAISAWNLIIMRTSFAAIPDSMIESAKIEGAGDVMILLRIIIPLSTAVIAVMILYYGVSNWNTWFNALIYLRDRKFYPLQLVLREILIANDTSRMTTSTISSADKEPLGLTIKYATIIIATLPVLTFYPFIQKYFIKGVMVGAIKG